MILKGLFQSLISSVGCQSLIGKCNLALAVVYFNDLGLHLVAYLYKIS